MVKQNTTTLIIIIIVILIIAIIIVIIWLIFRTITVVDDNTNGMALIPCSDTSDCPGTNICVDDFCRPECQAATDCPSGWSCINTSCEPECIDDLDCLTGWSCVDGTCIPECFNDNDCSVTETCNSGICQALSTGCNFVDVPFGLNASQTDTDEITATWSQAIGAAGYVCYLGTMSGFNQLQAIDSKLVSEPIRTAVFTGLAAGTYYVRVSATNVTCPGTALSTEVMVIVT